MRALAAILGLCLGACGVTEGQVFAHPDAAALAIDETPPGDDAGTAIDAGSTEPPTVIVDAGERPDVSFEWSETLPGQGTCHPGRYVGTFGCAVTAGSLPVALEGQVSFTLAGSEETQMLVVTDGVLGDAQGFFRAGLQGRLNCLTRKFTGDSVNGRVYAFPASALPPGTEQPPLFGFTAVFVGDYDDQALVIGGNWTMLNDGGGNCTGVWRVTAAP